MSAADMTAGNRAAGRGRERLTTREMVLAGMFAAVLAVISQLSIPMPTGVPVTIQVFGVVLTGAVLGWKLGLMATVAYILLGAVGLPIFANFRGGLQVLAGLTGGYIWSWTITVMLCGIRLKTPSKAFNTAFTFVFAFLGLAATEIIGGLQWAALAGDMSAGAVFAYSLAAFVPKDIALTVAAVVIAAPIRRLLARL